MFPPIDDPILREAAERYRAATGRHPFDEQPSLAYNLEMLDLFLIISGFAPKRDRPDDREKRE